MAARRRVPRATLWIASAGYGLLSEHDACASYSATFSPGTEDSVGRTWDPHVAAVQQWWIELSGEDWWKRLIHRRGITVGVLSQTYFMALYPGLEKLACALGERLVLIAPGVHGTGETLGKCIVPIDSRFEHIEASTRGDLAPTALDWLMRKFPPSKGWNLPALRRAVARVFEALPEPRVYDRRQLTDAEVIQFITKEIPQVSSPSASALLRRLRSMDFACEQKRFANLYRSWTAKPSSRKAFGA